MTRGLRYILTTIVWILVAGSGSSARADVERFAVVIGNNTGSGDDGTLLYAEDDARRIARILRELGQFSPDNVIEVTDESAVDVRRVIQRVNARIRQRPRDTVLFIFYSGHGDASALHMRGTELPMTELRDLVNGSAATARVLVVDACRSGTLTRVKGGRPGPAFSISFDQQLMAQGTAILTSSSAGEDSQESDDLRASFFTHYLASALIGAADDNDDGKITLSEAFRFASERTLAATARTIAGPQHPTYRFEIGGRGNLVLTAPGNEKARFGNLSFASPGTYLVQDSDEDGAPVAEVTVKTGARTLSLKPGSYFVTRRAPDHLRQGRFTVRANGVQAVVPERMQRLAYARVVRKGGTDSAAALSAFAGGGARGGIEGLGVAPRGELGMRVDFSFLSFEAKFGFAMSRADNAQLMVDTREYALSLAAVRVFDVGHSSVSIGIEGGASWLNQGFRDSPQTPGRNTVGGFVGPIAQGQVPLGDRYHLRLETGALTYLIKDGENSGLTTPIAWRGLLGVGRYF